MKFFFPDSQDQVGPYFNFITEEHPSHRIRQRDDLYAHEALRSLPYDGILLSKPIVDGLAGNSSRYSMAQRHRLYRLGVRQFLRVREEMLTMGDCGAFSYASEYEPPYTIDEVIDFYEGGGFDRGVAPDHVVFGFIGPDAAGPDRQKRDEWERRRRLTIDNAKRFLDRHETRSCTFEPMATAHGWNPQTYADSVEQLVSMGYSKIALGGMVTLKTEEILSSLVCVAGIAGVGCGIELHLFGVNRCDEVLEFGRLGVTTFDSTSPFRQAFKDDRDNYYTVDEGNFIALRVPQVDGNAALKRSIRAGKVDLASAQAAERRCMTTLRAFDRNATSVDEVVDALCAYEQIYDPKKDHRLAYEATLKAAPWRMCNCGICDEIGIEVAIFRGSERNKRRGFHNLAIMRQRLSLQLTSPATGEETT